MVLMVKVRKILGVVIVGLAAIAIALVVWDAPIVLPGLFTIDYNFFGGGDGFGNINFIALFAAIIIMEVAVGIAVFPTPKEVKEEEEMRRSLDTIRQNNEKVSKELTKEKMKHSELRNRFKDAVRDRRNINKTVNDLVMKGTKSFKGGDYPKAIEYWEKALSVEHDKTIRAMRIAEEKKDLMKSHTQTGRECPYCGAPLYGYEEICPECGENLLTEEEMIRKYILEGLRAFMGGDTTTSNAAWEKVLQIDPTNEEALTYMDKSLDIKEQAIAKPQAALPPVGATVDSDDDDLDSIGSDDDDLDDLDDEMDDPMADLDDDIGRIASMLDEAAPTGSMAAKGGPGIPADELSAQAEALPTSGDQEMYECEVCGAPMGSDQFVCPVCGEVYEE